MIKNESGFTLIEMIAVLVLVGIVAVIVAMSIVTGIHGYIFARDMAPISQKANLAMSRITRELMEISIVKSSASNSISFSDSYGGLRAIAFIPTLNQIRINNASAVPPTDTTGDILIDNVNSFTLTYYNGTNPWSCCDDAKSLSSITIDLVVNHTYGTPLTFFTAINPRNTGNYNAPII